ncbi:MAG TPA: class I SAM-dependent rRNA methyltransferase [Cyclobacteriaceae bacterium]|nr:class I SAM-dependent rRNA methyltransferase [Cyclobacteriaceae bacterium]
MKLPQIILKKGREASARRFHPWIFSGAIQSMPGDPADGDMVEVKESGGKTLGFGHYQKGTISVRILTFSGDAPPDNLYELKIKTAHSMRLTSGVVSHSTNCYRLIHGEGDGLPGLIVDIYNGVAVVQAHSAGMHQDRKKIAEALHSALPGELNSVFYKSQGTFPGSQNEYLSGMSAVPHSVMEHGNKFFVDWEEGQKTGFFLDQRENRRLMGAMSRGMNVLNTFCYTGGFSVYALAGGAASVHSVDASEKAIDLSRKNIELNGFDAQKNACFAEDVFDFIKDKKDIYDLIVLDPPAFAKHKDSRHQAMKGYQRLNAEAMRVIKPNGIIFTFSCSQVVDRQLFYDTVVSSAIQSGRDVKVLQTLSQPADHPVSLFHPEGEYLKGIVLFVN